ncbi:MAG: helix-turn-helix domain-containing protein [Prevotella sp.]|nr:helix-turn-helix domain-containing protein [Prevotella sp.]
MTLTVSCTGKVGETRAVARPANTYTQQAAMAIYGYQPERALLIIDSAVIVGNLSQMRADVNRAKIYSQSHMGQQLDSLLGGPEGVRYDTARAIGERLLLHDSLKDGQGPCQDVLEILIHTARMQQDSVRWLLRSRQLVSECRRHGKETKALRTEAEIGASLCFSGQPEQGMAMLDSAINSLTGGKDVSFYQLDALIIALKRKISVLAYFGRKEETLPLAHRMTELLDDYEQHPDRYRALQQQVEAEQQWERANHIRQQGVGIFLIALLAVAFALYALYMNRKTRRKNRALVQQIDEAMRYKDLYQSMVKEESAEPTASQPQAELTDAQLFAQIHGTIVRERLYLDPACDRQMLTDRFQLSKERLGALFAQYSQAKNIAAYINGLRLDYASHLLTSRPDMDIQAIAASSGFSTHRYFSTCFKQYFGLSPTAYRMAKTDV